MNKERACRIRVLSEEVTGKTIQVRAIARGVRFDIHQIIKLCAEIDGALNELALLRALDDAAKEEMAARLN